MKKAKYLFFLILPVVAVAVWYSPILFKGYSSQALTEQVVLGKNIAKTGMYSLESDLNVFLSSSLIKEEGHLSFMGNKLTGYLYALVFKVFGSLSWKRLVLFSASINALTLLIFAFLVFYLFNFRTSLIFSLLYIFFPFIWSEVPHLGVYEFALFFSSLFFLFYFLGQKSKYKFIFFPLAGLFLSLAGLARETFFLLVPLFFIYLLVKKEIKALLLIFIPVIVVLSVFYLPGFLTNHNDYFQLILPIRSPEKVEANDFIFYGEFYPDPYTYRFARENFLKDYDKVRDSLSLIPSVLWQKNAVGNIKADQISFGRRILLSILLLISHLGNFISWEAVAGPLIFLLMLWGLYYLKKERPELFNLFLYLILATIFILSFVILAGRSHLIDFGWMLALLAALGLISLFSLLEKYFQLNKKNFFILSGFIFLMVLYNLLLAGHSYWGRVYDNEDNLAILNYSFQIKKLNLSEKDVIALGTGATAGALALNYLTDKSVIVFQEQTVKNLLAEGGLASAFKKFGVTYIVGYPDDLSKKILAQAKVININSSQNNISGQNIISENNSLKSWLMNLIK